MAAFDYQLEATRVTEDAQQIVIHAQPPVTVSVLPGGKTWPLLALDAGGRIYAGATVIDARTGRVTPGEPALALPAGVSVAVDGDGYLLRQGRHACRLPLRRLHVAHGKSPLEVLKDANLAFAGNARQLLALATQFSADGKVAGYLVERIDVARCTVSVEQQLGNPDLLVELGYAPGGGWWVTGSIEQTLLHSTDGRHWRKVRLPDGLSSLASSYVADAREIWLAAVWPGANGPSPYLLVYSGDGGRHWRNLADGDPLLARIPAGWLEGQKRRVAP